MLAQDMRFFEWDRTQSKARVPTGGAISDAGERQLLPGFLKPRLPVV